MRKQIIQSSSPAIGSTAGGLDVAAITTSANGTAQLRNYKSKPQTSQPEHYYLKKKQNELNIGWTFGLGKIKGLRQWDGMNLN